MPQPTTHTEQYIPAHSFTAEHHAHMGFIVGDPANGRIIHANETAVKMFGYEPIEFQELTGMDLLADIQELDNSLSDRSKQGSFFNELKCRRKNGDIFPCEVFSVVYTDENGETKSLNTIVDISEKLAYSEELRKSNERYRLATRASFDAIWDVDLVSQTISWGEGFQTLFGYTTGDTPVSLKTWEDNIHPDDKERVIESYDHVLNNKNLDHWKDEYRFIKSDGSIAYVIDRGIFIRDKKGVAIRVVGAMQDITTIKLKEKELLNINDRFFFASQATADIIWDWDLVTNEILWADNFTRIMGHELPQNSQLPLNFCINNIHPDDRKPVADSLEVAIKNARELKWENKFRYRRIDNSYAFVSDRGYIIRDTNGKAIRMIGAMQDVSTAKYNEDLLALELNAYEISSTPGINFDEVVKTLLQGIEQMHPDMLSSVLSLNANNTICHFTSPRLPESYLKQIDGLQIGPCMGSCGSAMFNKEPVIVSDIQTDPLWTDFRDLANQYDLKACWSVPILQNNGNVLGSFAIYYNSIKKPSEQEWNTIIKIRNILRILMENEMAIQQIRLTNERFNIISEATNDMVWDWDLLSGKIFRDPNGLQKVYGLLNNELIDTSETWLERVHPQDKEKVEKILNEIVVSTDKKIFDIEYRYLGSTGNYSYVYDRGMVMHDANGKPYRMIGAAQNITERRMLEQQIFKSELNKQKAISQAIIDTQEKERGDIGRELHDNVNQVLTTTKLYLDLATTDPDKHNEFISKSSDNIMYVINEIRKLSHSLMLPSLGDLGLLESIIDLCESINVTQKIRIDFNADQSVEKKLTENQKLVIYRIIQEATNNIIRHAHANSVLIHIFIADGILHLIVSDDGKGFNKMKIKKGSGLNNIENRVYLFNGSLDINTSPDKGCELIIQVPLHQVRL